jgi:hypothetical protein
MTYKDLIDYIELRAKQHPDVLHTDKGSNYDIDVHGKHKQVFFIEYDTTQRSLKPMRFQLAFLMIKQYPQGKAKEHELQTLSDTNLLLDEVIEMLDQSDAMSCDESDRLSLTEYSDSNMAGWRAEITITPYVEELDRQLLELKLNPQDNA